MRAPASFAPLAACGLVAALGACGGDTAILVEVTRAEDVGAIERLAIYVGTDVVAGGGFADRTPDEDVALGSRDLLADPYRLALEPTDGSAERGVMVAALAYAGDAIVGFGALAAPVVFVDGETVRWPVVVEAALPEGLVVEADGCLRWYGEDGEPVSIGRPPDLDCDGASADGGDCDDLDPGVSPDALDACASGVDEDCDGAVDEDVDEDGDTFTTCGGDCDDRVAEVNPGAVEACDGVDNDCAAGCDDGFDLDGDRYTACGSKRHDDGHCDLDPAALTDCDDGDPMVRPFGEEVCDGLDNDCSGACDDKAELDPDGDDYTACGSVVGVCGVRDADADCEPDDATVSPGAAEICNGVDDDCDEGFLAAEPCFVAIAEACYRGTRVCEESGGTPTAGPCTSLAAPEDEVDPALCDGYATCAAEDDELEPYVCALEEVAAEALLCLVGYDAASGAQCPGRTAPLPPGVDDDCTYVVVGGVDHGDYRVGIVAPGETELQPTGPCDGLLDIFLASTPASSQVAVLERREEGQATVQLRIEIGPLPSATCSPPAGLTCAAAP